MFQLFEHSKYKIIHTFDNLWNFDSFRNCKFLEIFGIFEIGSFFGIFQVGNFWNFKIANFTNFTNRTCLEYSNLTIFRLLLIDNFRNFPNWKYLEFSKLEILGISSFLNLENQIWLQKRSVHSIFGITRNFADSHIFPLM